MSRSDSLEAIWGVSAGSCQETSLRESMMNDRNLFKIETLVVAGVLTLCVSLALFAQDNPLAGNERIEFDPPREASIRQTTRVVVRGELLAVSRRVALIQLEGRSGQPGKQIPVNMKTISVLRTTDGEFHYTKGDDFGELVDFAVRLDGVSIADDRVAYGSDMGGDDVPAAVPNTPPPNRPPGAGPRSMRPAQTGNRPGGFGSGGFGNRGFGGNRVGSGRQPVGTVPGTGTQPGAMPAENTPTATPIGSGFGSAPASSGGTSDTSSDSSAGSGPTSTAPSEIIVCGNCMKDVAVTAANGEKCPHCGILWAEPIYVPPAPTTIAHNTAAPGQSGMGQPAAGASGVVRPGAVAQPGPQQLPPPPAAPAATGMQDFDLATMPIWMKAGLFFGALAVAWMLIQRR